MEAGLWEEEIGGAPGKKMSSPVAWVSSPLVIVDEPTVEARAELEILALDLWEEEGEEV